MRAALFVAMVFVCAGVLPSSTSAWTRARVHSARADVRVEPDTSLRVRLLLDLRVDAGWLRELELAGLESDIELDRRRRPYLRSEENEIYRPSAEVLEDGRIRLQFERKEAPRRGEYRVIVHYRTAGAPKALEQDGSNQTRVHWAFPAWENGLHNVSASLSAPKGSSVPRELLDPPPGTEVEITEGRTGTTVRWRRVHLPRMTVWPLAIDVPRTAATPPAEEEPAPVVPSLRPLTPPERPFPMYLVLLAMLVLVKRLVVANERDTEPLFLRGSWLLTLATTCGVVAAGRWAGIYSPLLCLPLVCLCLSRSKAPRWTWFDQTWAPVHPSRLRRPEPRASDLLDATTVLGLLGLIVTLVVILEQGEPGAALFALPVFLTGTRWQKAPKSSEILRRLTTFVSELRLDPTEPSMSFAWERSTRGGSRLRVFLGAERPGVLSLSLIVVSQPRRAIVERSVMLLVETRAQSDADDVLRRFRPDLRVERGPSGRLARVLEWNGETLDLLHALSAEPVRRGRRRTSRGSWLLGKIAAQHREAA